MSKKTSIQKSNISDLEIKKINTELLQVKDQGKIWVAIHEAGHATIAWCIGFKLREISIESSGDIAGYVKITKRPIGELRRRAPRLLHPPDSTVSPTQRESIEKQIMLCQAGCLAQILFSSNAIREPRLKRKLRSIGEAIGGSQGDVADLQPLFRSVALFKFEMFGYEMMLRERTKALLDIYCPSCWELAKTLYKKNRLSGDEAQKLLDKSGERHVKYILSRVLNNVAGGIPNGL